MAQTVEYLGQTVEFPDGMSEDEMRNALLNDESLKQVWEQDGLSSKL